MLHVAHRYDPSLNLINVSRKVLKGAFLYEKFEVSELRSNGSIWRFEENKAYPL